MLVGDPGLAADIVVHSLDLVDESGHNLDTTATSANNSDVLVLHIYPSDIDYHDYSQTESYLYIISAIPAGTVEQLALKTVQARNGWPLPVVQ
jgi:hypothetical protein